MLQIGHRESFDVDIFVDDPQLLPYLNPCIQDLQLDTSPDDYEAGGASSLKLTFGGLGEIDFICAPALTKPHTRLLVVESHLAPVETLLEIVAKKIVHRGRHMQPRDMFDIAATVRSADNNDLLVGLEPYSAACLQAMHVADGMRPELVAASLDRLLVKAGFEDLRRTAQADTVRFPSRFAA
jgi:hypothetical protein